MTEDHLSTTKKRTFPRLLLPATIAMVSQLALVIVLAEEALGWMRVGVIVAVTIGLFAGFVALSQRQPSPLLEFIVVTVSIGGLGMMVGGFIDTVSVLSPLEPELALAPPCHRDLISEATPTNAVMELITWMNATMIVSCVLGCVLLCESCRCTNRRAMWGVHCIVAIGMVAGMPVGRWILGPGLSELLGAHLGIHLAMVAGMAAGVALSWPLAGPLRRAPQAQRVHPQNRR